VPPDAGTRVSRGAFLGGARRERGTQVTKWTKIDAWGVAIVGVILVGGVFAWSYLQTPRYLSNTNYAVDMPSAPDFEQLGCSLCWTVDGLDLTDRAAGVAADLPTDPVFRGVVLTGNDFPETVRNVRVMPDGYYIQFTDGTVRFVADDAPWVAVVQELRERLSPRFLDILVGAGIIDSDLGGTT
jgi:hypothetical protein